MSNCGDEACEYCEREPAVDLEFEGYRSGMYQAMQMLGAPTAVLILMAGSTTRSECVMRFNAWMEAR